MTVQSLDTAGYAINTSPKNLALTYLPNPNAQLTATRTNLVVQRATQLQLQIGLVTRLQAGSDLTVTIPESALTNPQQVKVLLDGTLVFSTLKKVTTDGVAWHVLKIPLVQGYND